MESPRRWEGPRKVVLEKSSQGYGFTLRQFIVYPPESTVAGVHTSDEGETVANGTFKDKGLEPMDTIFVKQVRDGSPAKLAGLNPGDRIVSVNGENISGKEYRQVVNQIQSCKSALTLQVVPRKDDILQMAYPSSSLQSPRNKAGELKDDTAPSQEENDSILSDDDVIILGKDRQTIKTEQEEPQVPVMETQTFTTKVEIKPSTHHWRNTAQDDMGYSPQKTGSDSRVIELKIPKKDNVLRKHKSLDLPHETQSTTLQADAGIESRIVNQGSPQKDTKTFRITGILGTPVSKPSRPSVTLQADGNNETASSSPMSKYVLPSNILPSKQMLVKMDVPEDRNSGSEDRKLGVPIRMKVVPREQVISPKRSDGGPRNFRGGGKEEGHRSHSTTTDTILDASNPTVKITKANDVFFDECDPGAENHNFNRKLSDSSVSYDLNQSTVFHEDGPVSRSPRHYGSKENMGGSRGPVDGSGGRKRSEYSHRDKGYQQFQIIQQGEMEETKYREADGKEKKKFTFQTTATINVPDRTRRRESPASSETETDGPPVPERTSSRGRVRDRSLERNRDKERSFQEKKHRSKSYDRGYSRSTPSMRQHAAYAERAQESQLRLQRMSQSSQRESESSDLPFDEFENFGVFHDDLDFMKAISGAAMARRGFRTKAKAASSPDVELHQVFNDDLDFMKAISGAAMGRRGFRTNTRAASAPDVELDQAFCDDYNFLASISNAVVARRPRRRSRTTPPSPDMMKDEASKQYLVRRTSYLRATGSDEEREADKKNFAEREKGMKVKRSSTNKGPQLEKPSLLFDDSLRHRLNSEGDARPAHSIPDSTNEVVKEGLVIVKMDQTKDGKKVVGSWRPVWAILKNHTLTLLKENRNSSGNTSGVEEYPIDIRQAMVDIAYIKKKNVFRLCTVEGNDFLFQVNDKETMLAWIACIRANRITEEEEGFISEDILIRRSHLKDPNFNQPMKSPAGDSKVKKEKTAVKEEVSKSKLPQRGSKKKKKGPYVSSNEELSADSSVFGVSIDACTPSPNNEFVPFFVEKCCSIVEERGLDVVGVYRVPGNNAGISFLKTELKKPILDVDFSNDRWKDVNVVSSLLKLYFRKLPNPLIPKDQYSEFIKANRTPGASERMAALRYQIHNLPEKHFETLKFLTNHLKKVSANSSVNKMEIRNLAIVFGPTLIRTADDNMMALVQDMSDQCRIVESVIQHCDWFFSEDVESQQAVPSDAVLNMEAMPDANVLLDKAKKEMKGDTISPKDIVQSVLSAANKKLKKDRKSIDGKDLLDSADYRRVRSRSGSNQSSDNQLSSKESSRTDSQSTDNDFSPTLRHSKDSHRSEVVISTGVRHRKDSGSDSCSSKGLESPGQFFIDLPDFQFGSVRGRNISGGSEELLEGLKDVNTTVNWVIRDPSPHLTNRRKNNEYARHIERLEKEHAKALQDYEKEETSNIDEFIKSKDFLKDLCVSTKLQEMENSLNYPDSSSVTSDYSTTSSNNNNPNDNTLRFPGDFKNNSLPITPDSQESQGSVEESEFFKSVTAAFDEKFQTMFREEDAHTSSPEENMDSSPRRSKSYSSPPEVQVTPSSEDPLIRPSYLSLSPKHSRLGSSSSLPVTPRSPLKKSRVEVTVVLEKIEKTPREEKSIIIKSSQSTPIKKADSLRERKKRRMDRKRRHTLGGIKDVKNVRTIEITLFGEQTTTPRNSCSSHSTLSPSGNSVQSLDGQRTARNSSSFVDKDSDQNTPEPQRNRSSRRVISKHRSLELDEYL